MKVQKFLRKKLKRKFSLLKHKRSRRLKNKIQPTYLRNLLPQYYFKFILKFKKFKKFFRTRRKIRRKFWLYKKQFLYMQFTRKSQFSNTYRDSVINHKKVNNYNPFIIANNITKNLIYNFSQKFSFKVNISNLYNLYSKPNFHYLSLQPLIQPQRIYLKKLTIWRQGWRYNQYLAKLKLTKKRLKRWTNRYRKIKKNTAYNTLIFRQFLIITGISIATIKQLWLALRHSNNNAYGINKLVNIFASLLLLLPHHLLYLTRIAPTIAASQFLIKHGMVICNGATISSSMPLKPGDILQLSLTSIKQASLMFSYHNRRFNDNKLNSYSFLHFDRSLSMLLLLRYPLPYELIFPSFLSPRWVRYFIRQFPTKRKQYIKYVNYGNYF